MLSSNPRKQRIFSRKMYKESLLRIHVESMKILNSKVQGNRKGSTLCGQTCIDESSTIVTVKKFSSSQSCQRELRTWTKDSNSCRCLGDQSEDCIKSDKTTLPVRSKSKRNLRDEANNLSQMLGKSSCPQTGYGWWVLLLLSLLFVCGDCHSDKNQTNANITDKQCALGIKTPGRTWPTGDIKLEYGQPLRIYCILNETLTDPKLAGKNASDLIFFRNDKEMEPEYITVVNSTTSMIFVEKPAPSHDMYYCRLRLHHNKTEAVCLNQVIIGFKPLRPLNFTCISENWQRLICTWEPAPNDMVTQFSLAFRLPGRAGRTLFECPAPENGRKPPENMCMWDTSTRPHYRQVYEQWKFRLSASNFLGNDTFEYDFIHYAHVIPSKPVDLSVINKTYSNATLYWKIPYPLPAYPGGLDYRISYQSQYDPRKTWEQIYIKDQRGTDDKNYTMTGLKHANAVYDVRVAIKSSKATGENYWSQFSDITFKTSPTLPGRAPRTDIGSFEIAVSRKSRDVYVYWQTIPVELQNGDNFTYEIISVEENGKPSSRQPSEKKSSYAKFKDISFGSLKFEIAASNCVGRSKDKATVYVPPDSEKPPEPVSFTKIAFDGGLYELSWNPMSNGSNITNYTIFWCENERDRPYQCTGYLDWIQVPRNINIYNTTVPDPEKTYQFAIAANTVKGSSGMVWAMCTAIHNRFVDKMRSVWINTITSDTIQVVWKLECSDRMDIIKGFIIYYCPIVAPQNTNCKDPMMNTTVVGGPHTMYGNVVGLKPYTTYKLTVAVLTKNGEGHQSDPLYNTTLEGAPTPPQSVSVTEVSNTSFTVKWNPPVAVNGMLHYYTVYFNDNVTKVENATSVQIDGLKPYEEYQVSVSAWSIKEGNRSEPIILTTQIGEPGKTGPPGISFDNSSQVRIKWYPPKHAGGKLDYYEIMSDDEIYSNITTCKTECEAHLSIPDCSDAGQEKLYRFRIRAINFGYNMERFEGPWSEVGEGNCFISGPSNLVWVIIWIIGCFSGVAFLMFLGYSSKRIWIKCKQMQDVEVKLPPGLQPNMKLLGKGNEQYAQQMSADSSGCSSGQESVTSSLTSDSHVSTDSGADLDPVPMSPTKLLESPPAWEATSLRQRNVSGTTKPDSSNDRGSWDPYVKVAQTIDTPAVDSLSPRSTPNLLDGIAVSTTPGLYHASQQHPWSSTGYISMPSSEEDSSNNPSPLLRGKGCAQGVYSVVGLVPSPMPRTKAAEWSHPKTADLIPLGSEAKEPKKEPVVVNPYVSLASLEQKMIGGGGGGGGNTQISSLGDLADMELFRQAREQEPPPPYSISDKLSKPYVQTGMIGPIKMSRPAIEHDDPNSQRARYAAATTTEPTGGRPPLSQNFPDPPVSVTQSLIELPSNIYVPVETARGMPSPRVNKEQNPYVAVTALMSTSPDAPASCLSNKRVGGTEDHSASSYAFSPQLIDTLNTKTQQLPDCDDPVTRSVTSSPAPLPVVKQTSGYVTIAENPTRSTDEQKFEGGSSTSYVSHQRVNEKSPPPGYQQNIGQADEQYSKVTVVPHTT